MIVGHIDDCAIMPVHFEGITGMSKQVPLSPAQGWKGYVMRVFALKKDCHSPRHRHPWPHINWIIDGTGLLHIDGTDHPVRNGSYAYIPSGALHQFTNTGNSPFTFICIVPEEGEA